MKIRSFIGTYKATFEVLDDNKEQALAWLKAFLLLFFLPVLYPLLWIVLKLKEAVNEN